MRIHDSQSFVDHWSNLFTFCGETFKFLTTQFTKRARYSKNPHKRIGVLGFQADFVLIHPVFSAKSA